MQIKDSKFLIGDNFDPSGDLWFILYDGDNVTLRFLNLNEVEKLRDHLTKVIDANKNPA